MIIISGSAVLNGYRAIINARTGGEYMTSMVPPNRNFSAKIRFTGKVLTPLRRKI